MNVLLCDAHQLFLESLAAALRAAGHQVTETRRPDDAVLSASKVVPDLCVVDLHFAEPDIDGRCTVDAVPAIRRLARMTAVLVLTGSPTGPTRLVLGEDHIPVAEKTLPLRSLLKAMDSVVAGGGVAERADKGGVALSCAERPLVSFLTEREAQVLEGLVRGWSTSELAEKLGCRPATARTHVQGLLAKLCVHSRLEAVAVAVRHQLVDLAHVG